MNITVKFNVSDVNVKNCSLIVQSIGGNTSVPATLSGNAASLGYEECRAEINYSHMQGQGWFAIYPEATDRTNTNATLDTATVELTNISLNNTYVQTAIDGYTLIQVSPSRSLGEIANLSSNITIVSYFNNINRTYRTFLKGLTTNRDFAVSNGYPVYIYTNRSVALLRQWDSNLGVSSYNVTLNRTWNQITFWNNSGTTLSHSLSMNKTFNFTNQTVEVGIDPTNGQGLVYSSFYNSTMRRYTSYRWNFTYNYDKMVPRGYGMWLNFNATTANTTALVNVNTHADWR